MMFHLQGGGSLCTISAISADYNGRSPGLTRFNVSLGDAKSAAAILHVFACRFETQYLDMWSTTEELYSSAWIHLCFCALHPLIGYSSMQLTRGIPQSEFQSPDI
jgi:hypothetical protein